MWQCLHRGAESTGGRRLTGLINRICHWLLAVFRRTAKLIVAITGSLALLLAWLMGPFFGNGEY